MKMREEFEAWVLSRYPNQHMGKFNTGEYHSTTVDYCWLAWQAALGQLPAIAPSTNEAPAACETCDGRKTVPCIANPAWRNDCPECCEEEG